MTSPSINKHNVGQLNYYELFGLDRSTVVFDPPTLASVSRTARRYSLIFHPDKDGSPEARTAFEVVQRAVEVLTDATLRRSYDAEIDPAPSGAMDAEGQRRARESDLEARQAEEILLRQEAALAEAARTRQAAEEERTRAARTMLEELTGALHTPVQQLEQALIDSWDVDDDLVRLKLQEVELVLKELSKHNHVHEGWAASTKSGEGLKRPRP